MSEMISTRPTPSGDQREYTLQEIRQHAEELYRREIRPKVMPLHKGKFLVVDIESGDYEIDEDDLSASDGVTQRSFTRRSTAPRNFFE